jgi:4-amino-4-deoxy-L-arabinose transferase-like glycosyltransferase
MKPASPRQADALAALLILLFLCLLFRLAPWQGDFYWSDAPRHALNGVFVKDLLAAAPFSAPQEYALRYYAQYPALTILFYPPLFYALSAPLYALFGVSHATALFAVFLHYAALAWGSYRLAGLWLPREAAMLCALTVIALPEVAFWGRQIMLEVPAFAFLVWSAYYFVRYLRDERPWGMYLACALLVLGMYTKISLAFMAPVYALMLLTRKRWGLLHDRHVWGALLLSVVSLVPLMVLTVKFGQANVQSVTGIADAEVSRGSLSGWLWYLRQLPAQLGWTALAGAALGAIALAVAAVRRRLEGLGEQVVFLGAWFCVGYVFFSAIDLKEARHSVFLLLPAVLAAYLALSLLPQRTLALGLGIALAAGTLGQTLWSRPVFAVSGYAQAVDYLAHHAPKDSAVIFSGYRDGAFVFNMRTREDRRDLSVVRADKLLLRVAVRRELGVEQKALSESDIRALIHASGAHYIVVQPGFWNDLEVMRRFEAVLASDEFERVERIATPANFPAHEQELVIYRNKGPVAKRSDAFQIELPIIGRKIEGK